MAIKNPFAVKALEHLELVEKMCKATTKDSLDAIQERVKDLTPVGTADWTNKVPGKLKSSITTTPVAAANDTYRGAVFSDVEYAKFVEYGTSPHEIRATNAKALRLADGRFFAKVDHPGYRGVHMFRRGGLEFAQMEATQIARTNATKFLGAV